MLGCVPEQLENASIEDIQRAASFAAGAENLLGGARRFLQSQDWWDEGKANLEKAAEPEKPAFDPLGFVGNRDKDEEEEAELLLPQVEIEGEMYMYDFKGEYNGVEHVLLTLDGEAVGVWNPETQEAEDCVFEYGEEE